MNQTIDLAKNELSKLQSGNQQAGQGAGDAQLDSSDPSVDAYGQQGEPGQYGQPGQYGAVRGGGFGGGLAKDSQGQSLQDQGAQNGQGGPQGGPQGERKHRASVYEGMEMDDSTATGGYGKNAQGSSFSRANQMGADDSAAVFDDENDNAGYKTGASTPGYRREDDMDAGDAEARASRLSNKNTYGAQADDRGSTGNRYNEAEEPQI